MEPGNLFQIPDPKKALHLEGIRFSCSFLNDSRARSKEETLSDLVPTSLIQAKRAMEAILEAALDDLSSPTEEHSLLKTLKVIATPGFSAVPAAKMLARYLEEIDREKHPQEIYWTIRALGNTDGDISDAVPALQRLYEAFEIIRSSQQLVQGSRFFHTSLFALGRTIGSTTQKNHLEFRKKVLEDMVKYAREESSDSALQIPEGGFSLRAGALRILCFFTPEEIKEIDLNLAEIITQNTSTLRTAGAIQLLGRKRKIHPEEYEALFGILQSEQEKFREAAPRTDLTIRERLSKATQVLAKYHQDPECTQRLAEMILSDTPEERNNALAILRETKGELSDKILDALWASLEKQEKDRLKSIARILLLRDKKFYERAITAKIPGDFVEQVCAQRLQSLNDPEAVTVPEEQNQNIGLFFEYALMNIASLSEDIRSLIYHSLKSLEKSDQPYEPTNRILLYAFHEVTQSSVKADHPVFNFLLNTTAPGVNRTLASGAASYYTEEKIQNPGGKFIGTATIRRGFGGVLAGIQQEVNSSQPGFVKFLRDYAKKYGNDALTLRETLDRFAKYSPLPGIRADARQALEFIGEA